MSEMRRQVSGAQALLLGLKALGIDYILGNVGTDYPPILGAYAQFQQEGRLGEDVPVPITVPHETVAMNMAYGYYLQSGRPAAVFVHTNVGTANALMSLINAERAQVPLLLFAGLAPATEQHSRTSKPGFIHWAQEMADQAGMVRESVKWHYHISGDNIAEIDLILARAYALALSAPAGPVYLTFAPEAVEQIISIPAPIQPPVLPSPPQPDPASIQTIASWLASAQRPLIISSGTDRDHNILPALVNLAEAQSAGVTGLMPRNLHFPLGHKLWLGDNPHAAVPEADLIISLESDVPYMPIHARPGQDCRVVHVGPDPLLSRYPRRGFRADAVVTSAIVPFLGALQTATAAPDAALTERRRRWVGAIQQGKAAQRAAEIARAKELGEMTYGWISHCVNELAMAHEEIVVLREFDLRGDYLTLAEPGRFFALPNAGGLGWGMGAALGIRLAEPGKLPVLGTGDGCYYFSAPLAAHQVARSQNLPFITIIFNNGQWATVTNYVNRWYPDLEEPAPPLTSLGPPPAFEKIVAAFDGYGERVEKPAELPPALARAYAAAQRGQQAVLNVII
ncbi:MAG: thiamine pyrophosphate-requiring protein [Ardenticatenales bacterium]|nr:thiamine pyrophosphate-requiring protein [Ardenticatenales bacterium]